MNTARNRRLSLSVFVLIAAFAWSLPAAAEETDAATAELSVGGACPADVSFTPDRDESVPAQSCGPCPVDFCGAAFVRCTFSHCEVSPECCVYDCVCDSSCSSGGIPSGLCARLPLSCCGNGVQEKPEACDGDDLNGKTCASFGFCGGTLACGPDCGFDTSGCVPCCGNEICNPGEDCETCSQDCDSETHGPPSGRFCCGNGILEPAEGNGDICDGNP